MLEPRKASDILISLESEVKILKNTINVQDLAIKTILKNVNEINTLMKSVINTSTEEQKIGIENDREIVSNVPSFNVETDFKGQRRMQTTIEQPSLPNTKASNVNIEFKDYMKQRQKPIIQEEFKPKPLDTKSDKKIPVVQRIQDNNNKDLFMAEVNLISMDGGVVLKTKTNALGKWQGQLAPGKYIVKVSKMDNSIQKKIENQQEITVANHSGTLTLPTLIVNRS